MSNYSVPQLEDDDRDLDIYVGWDPKLNTYYAHVIDNKKDEDDEDRDVLRIGVLTNEIHDLGIVVDTLISHRIEVNDDILVKLYRDANE